MSIIERPRTVETPAVDPAIEEHRELTIPPEAEMLELAADIIEREGWARHSYAAWGRRCAVGAISSASNRMDLPRGTKLPTWRRAIAAVAETIPMTEYMQKQIGSNKRDRIVFWNDKIANKTAVVRKLREVAADLAR